jgi:cation diffusion facilitator CzcD-associated flavoprotein CzcO
MGGLHYPMYPDIPGREEFSGTQLHTTRWDPNYDPTGRTIAVIGSGASAVQAAPELRKTARQVVVVQRTANWMIPRYDDGPYAESTRRWFHRIPLLMWLIRLAFYIYAELVYFLVFDNPDRWTAKFFRRQLVNFIRHEVRDPKLHAPLTPSYAPGCKRVLICHQFYHALNEPNVQLECKRIARITPTGLLMDDGATHDVDTLVWATGFDLLKTFPPLAGRHGRDLVQSWDHGENVVTNLGICVPDFPNFFMLLVCSFSSSFSFLFVPFS